MTVRGLFDPMLRAPSRRPSWFLLSWAGVALSMAFSLAGCFVPEQTKGADQAVQLYHQSRTADGAVIVVREESGHSPKTPEPSRGILPEIVSASVAPKHLSLDISLERARAISARLATFRARVEAAEAAVEAAGQYNNPELQITQLRLDQWVDGQPQVRPMLHLTPNRPGEIDARIGFAKASVAEAKSALVAEELALEAEIRWLYEDATLMNAELQAAERGVAARKKLLAQMNQRLKVSEATSMDAALAELATIEAEQDNGERILKKNAAVAALLERLGWPPNASVELDSLADNIAELPPLPPEETVVEAALKNNPVIAASAARIDGAAARLYVERSKRYPWLTSIEVGYQFGPGVREGLGWVFQAGVELPIFHTNGGAIRAAEAMTESERHLLTSETERVVRDVREKWRDVDASGKLVQSFRDRTQEALRRVQQETERVLEQQGIDVVKALMIEERRWALELNAARLTRRYRAALFALRRAVGGPIPGYHP